MRVKQTMGRSQDKIKLFQLRALVSVAKHQNFSRAADDLELSQSSVSHAIATLESELGIILFSRSRQGAQLTPVGETILSKAHIILSTLDAIEVDASQIRGAKGGTVRVAAIRSLATSFLPHAIVQFKHQFSAINISLVECVHQEDVEQVLLEEQADIGLVHLPTQADFETWELFRDEFLLVLPLDSADAKSALSWEAIAQYPMILSPRNDSCHNMVVQHFTHHHQPLNIVYNIRDASTILSMVRQGLGATIMHRAEIAPFISDFHVVPLPVPLERIHGIAVIKEAFHLPATYMFLELLKTLAEPYMLTNFETI